MIIGCAITPHGSLILPVSADNSSKESVIHNAMKQLATHIQELKPDIMFLSTPHGIALEDNFGIYKNEQAYGTAEWKLEYKEYISDLNLDSNIANSLLRHLKEKNHSIEGITTFSATEPIPLRWGEVVPAWFLRDIQTKYVILTQPSRRINKAIDMIPELQALGSDIVSYLHTLAEKVFVLISGDMAHTYQTDGPGPYGIHPSAQPFDDAVEQWAKSLNRNFLLKEAGSMLNTALACGFTGFVFLDSLMSSLKKNIKSQVFCNLHPTYYGMMVAKFDIIS